MKSNSRECEVSTYTQSSGYSSSSTASSSLNYIDDDHLIPTTIIVKHIGSQSSDPAHPIITKLIITITLLKVEEKVFAVCVACI